MPTLRPAFNNKECENIFPGALIAFTVIKFFRLHFVQMTRKDSSDQNWPKSRFVDFG